MIARLLISLDKEKREEEIHKILNLHPGLSLHRGGVKLNHPDVLYFKAGEKLGIAEARKVKAHFSLKPYSTKGRVVVVEDAGGLTHEAQNALLKTIEELPEEAVLILGAPSDANLLPTILSRCQISHLEPAGYNTLEYHKNFAADLEKLLESPVEERFEYIEKLKEKDRFLHFLTFAFREKLHAPGLRLRGRSDSRRGRPAPHQTVQDPARLEAAEFLKELLQSEQWAKQNVNIRAILEYLMLVMPRNI